VPLLDASPLDVDREETVDLIDRLQEISNRAKRHGATVKTEEAAKTALVLPFFQALGYDVFDPDEVVPELVADHGMKKGEKVDYGIKHEGRIQIIVECKPVGADLAAKHASQLFRYFTVTEARIGILTDGIRYLFFSDTDQPNKMDDRPFFEFSVLEFSEGDVEQLKKLSKSAFNLDSIINAASSLKYHRALIQELVAEFGAPSEDLVRLIAGRVYSGRMTQSVKDEFTGLMKRAMDQFLADRVNARLKSAIVEVDVPAITEEPSDGIVTTDDEIQGYRIIQAMVAEVADADRVFMRDAKSYCAIILDDNNRRTLARLYFNANKLHVVLFDGAEERRVTLAKVSDLYSHKAAIHATVSKHQAAK